MSKLSLILLIVLFPGLIFCQADTLNQIDSSGLKQGYWIVYGINQPNKGYCDSCKIEEGFYLNNRKEGKWMKYHYDGVTPRLIGEYSAGRPTGAFTKFYESGTIQESGNFRESQTIEENDITPNGKLEGSWFYYYESGCLWQEKHFNDEGDEEGRTTFFYDNCDTTENIRGEVNIQYDKVSGIPTDTIYHYYPNGDLKECIVIYGKGYHSRVLAHEKYERVNPPKQYRPGSNIEDDKIWFDGEFRNGKFWSGKRYYYDADGLLIKIEIWKEGKYYSDGR